MVLPQVAHLPSWCIALTAGRPAVARDAGPDERRAARPVAAVGVLLAALGLAYWSHRTLLGRDAGVTLIVVLLALKTLELRARRDAFVVFFLGFFTMLTNFFFSQSLLTAAGHAGLRCWGC